MEQLDFRPRKQVYAATSPMLRDPRLPDHITLVEAEAIVKRAREMGMSDTAKVEIDYDANYMADRFIITEEVDS